MSKFPAGMPPEAEAVKSQQREKIRRGIVALFEELSSEYKIAEVRKRARVDSKAVSTIVRLYRDGKMPPLHEPWGVDGAVPRRPKRELSEDDSKGLVEARQELAGAISAAETDEDRRRCSQEVGRLVVLGALSDKEAREARAAIAEARHGADAERKHADEETRQRLILCTDEGWRLVRVFEGLVDDDRRKRLLEAAVAAAREDLAERPNEDLGGAA